MRNESIRIMKSDVLRIEICPEEHAAITALKQILQKAGDELSSEEQLALIKCFIDHPVEEENVHYSALIKILELFVGANNSAHFLSSLVDLSGAHILTQENFSAIATHKDRESIHAALWIMSDHKGLLTQKNFSAIMGHADPLKLAEGLIMLSKEGILSQENWQIIVSHPEPDEVASHFCELHKEGILTPENKEFILRVGRRASTVISILHRNEILTDANRNAIIAINPDTRRALLSVICILSRNNLLTQNTFNQLLAPEHALLLNDNVRNQIWSRIPRHLFTPAVLAQFFDLARRNVGMAEITQYLDRLLAGNHANVAVAPNQNMNPAQSTHTASVHKTVSASALRLNRRYGDKLRSEGVKKILHALTEWVMELPKDLAGTPKNAAAKQCISRITESSFVDPDSQIQTPTLLALTWLAIHDDNQRKGLLEDTCNLWVEGLYEIQRGYNLSAVGVDDGEKDRPICEAGTFNKLIEKLQGVHCDAEIIHLTKARAAEKLQIVVKEEVKRYLSDSGSSLDEVFQKLEKGGIQEIWDKIQPAIADRIFEEFGSLFNGDRGNPEFIGIISYGREVELGDLSALKPMRTTPRLSTNEMTLFSTESGNIKHEVGNVCLFIRKNEPRKTFPYHLYAERDGVRVTNSRMDFSLVTRDALLSAMKVGTPELIRTLHPRGETASKNAEILREELGRNNQLRPTK